jgi:hypothetical protein
VLYRDNWTQLASQEIIKMQTELFHSIRQQVITSGRVKELFHSIRQQVITSGRVKELFHSIRQQHMIKLDRLMSFSTVSYSK